MAKIPVAPFYFKATFSLGTDEYTAHVNEARFVPTQPTATWTDIDDVTHTFAGKSTWVLNLAGVQDWETLNSLSSYLNEHEGETVTATIETPEGATHTADVIAAAVEIGGANGSPATFSQSLQSTKPVTTPAA